MPRPLPPSPYSDRNATSGCVRAARQAGIAPAAAARAASRTTAATSIGTSVGDRGRTSSRSGQPTRRRARRSRRPVHAHRIRRLRVCFCGAAYPVVEEVQTASGADVAFVYRRFPLGQDPIRTPSVPRKPPSRWRAAPRHARAATGARGRHRRRSQRQRHTYVLINGQCDDGPHDAVWISAAIRTALVLIPPPGRVHHR